MDTVSIDLAEVAGRYRALVDEALAHHLPVGPGCPARLAEAMRYSLLAPGKRLRPMLVLMAAEACGGRLEDAIPAACAVEMVHAYSLIHDDLPAMDDDDLRRGRPTCHRQFDEATAILAGDGLLTLAFEVLASRVRPGQVAARCCAVLASAAGAAGMVGGQADDVAGGLQGEGLERIESIHARKTGALIGASLELGALCAGADPARVEALKAFGGRIGLAFQITDDLLDVRGSAGEVGKRLGKDAQQGKATYPGLLGVEASIRRAERLIEEACAALGPFGDGGAGLEAVGRFVLERNR
ncbi:MAG: polyprenyl synthetase family protein [Thermoguttaceae bacterium]